VDSRTIDAFRRDGHVVVRDLAPRAEIERYRPILRAIVDAKKGDAQGRIDDYSKLFTQVTNVWRCSDDARAIVFEPRFARAAAALLGAKAVRIYHDQALFKPAGAARTPWHQDRYYWPLDTKLTVTMWLPLTDVDDAMGPMTFASGSHRATALGELAISEATDARLARVIEERGWPVGKSPIRAGDATFHYGATLHSAGANASDRTREVLTVIYFADGTRVAEPANENQRVDLSVFLPGLKPGDLAASELNPLVAEAL
jgi:ectoine hydroxylase-related dioxygenase (phytanoyl-CoA dioxygenase family)